MPLLFWGDQDTIEGFLVTTQHPVLQYFKDITIFMRSPYTNAIEAAAVGALEAVPLCAGILVNLMAFLSIFSVFNRMLTWLGYRIGMARDLTFEVSVLLCRC